MSELGAGSADPLVVTIEDVKPVVACRGCLATEQPLWLLDHKLANAYSLLISKIHDSDIYPKYICNYCRALLIKFNKFRNKCLFTQTTLTNIHAMGIPITLDCVKSCSTISSYSFKQTDTLLISVDIDDVKSSQLTQNYKESFATPDLIVQNEPKNQPNYSDIKKEAKIEVEIIPDAEILVTDYNNESLPGNESTSFDYHLAQDVSDVKLQRSDKTRKKNKYNNRKHNSHENSDSDGIASQNNDELSITPQNSDEIYKVGKRLSRKQKLYNEKLLKKREEFGKRFNLKIVKISQEKQIQQINERKNTDKYKNSPYKCELCYSGFISSITYKNHMAKHEPVDGYHICVICKCYYRTLTILSAHNQHHMNDYICNMCGHVSKTNGDARVHYGEHNGVVYTCNICKKSFRKPSTLTSHIVLTHKGNVPCQICNNLFIGENGLNLHMKTMHKEAIGAVCASCGVQFHSVSAMQRHRPQGDCDHTHRPCTACGEGFTSDWLLEQHKPFCESIKQYRCEICNVGFDSRKTFHFHRRNRHDVTNFSYTPRKRAAGPSDDADSASKSRKYSNSLKKICEFCGKSVERTGWELHRRRVHNTEGGTLFNCDHCGKGYHTKTELVNHMYKHNGLKPHSCKYCNKTFTALHSKRRHEKLVHEGVRQYACDICGYLFKARGDLQRHVQHTHHGVPWPKRDRTRSRQMNASLPTLQ